MSSPSSATAPCCSSHRGGNACGYPTTAKTAPAPPMPLTTTPALPSSCGSEQHIDEQTNSRTLRYTWDPYAREGQTAVLECILGSGCCGPCSSKAQQHHSTSSCCSSSCGKSNSNHSSNSNNDDHTVQSGCGDLAHKCGCSSDGASTNSPTSEQQPSEIPHASHTHVPGRSATVPTGPTQATGRPRFIPTSEDCEINEQLIADEAANNTIAFTAPLTCSGGLKVEKAVTITCSHHPDKKPKKAQDLKTLFDANGSGHFWKCCHNSTHNKRQASKIPQYREIHLQVNGRSYPPVTLSNNIVSAFDAISSQLDFADKLIETDCKCPPQTLDAKGRPPKVNKIPVDIEMRLVDTPTAPIVDANELVARINMLACPCGDGGADGECCDKDSTQGAPTGCCGQKKEDEKEAPTQKSCCGCSGNACQ